MNHKEQRATELKEKDRSRDIAGFTTESLSASLILFFRLSLQLLLHQLFLL